MYTKCHIKATEQQNYRLHSYNLVCIQFSDLTRKEVWKSMRFEAEERRIPHKVIIDTAHKKQKNIFVFTGSL